MCSLFHHHFRQSNNYKAQTKTTATPHLCQKLTAFFSADFCRTFSLMAQWRDWIRHRNISTAFNTILQYWMAEFTTKSVFLHLGFLLLFPSMAENPLCHGFFLFLGYGGSGFPEVPQDTFETDATVCTESWTDLLFHSDLFLVLLQLMPLSCIMSLQKLLTTLGLGLGLG